MSMLRSTSKRHCRERASRLREAEFKAPVGAFSFGGRGLQARDDSASVICPYCGQENEILLDWGGAAWQDYEEDCQVCCRPWRVNVRYGEDGTATVEALPLEG